MLMNQPIPNTKPCPITRRYPWACTSAHYREACRIFLTTLSMKIGRQIDYCGQIPAAECVAEKDFIPLPTNQPLPINEETFMPTATNTIIDLNNKLFAQLDRLSDEKLTAEAMASEINRAKAVTEIACQIISVGSLALKAKIALKSGSDLGGTLPKMLEA
jgi:hypothetical protein